MKIRKWQVTDGMKSKRTHFKLKKVLLKAEGQSLMLANQETQKAVKTYTDMFEKNKSIMLLIDWETGKIMNHNTAAEEFYGYTEDRFKTLNIKEIDTRPSFEIDDIMKRIMHGEIDNFETKHQLSSGDSRYVEVFSSLVEKDERIFLYAIIHDITLRKRVEDNLLKSEEKFRAIFEEAPFGVGIFNSNTGFAFEINEKFSEIVGRPMEELRRLDWKDYTHPDDIYESLEKSQLFKEDVINAYNIEKRFIKPDGTFVWVKLAVTAFKEVVKGIHLCMIQDISDSKKKEAEVQYLSYHDALTGLYNRAYFEEELLRFDYSRIEDKSIIMGDINGLKMVNDSFGHAEGDRLLVEMSKVLKSCCRKEDVLCRIGGDEFALLLYNADYQEAREACERIYKACETYNEKENSVVQNLSISLGYATKNGQGHSVNDILKEADKMLYIRKNRDRKS